MATANELRADLNGPGNVALVIDALKFWNLAAKPSQLLEAHKSRSEPNSQAIFQEIRNVAIELANDHSRFDLALSLTKACQQIFADLPRAAEQLTEDENTLNDRIVTSKIDPLATTINKLDDDLQTLAADLRKYGFGKNATGVAKVLRSTFLAVVQDSKGSSAEALSWLMLRSIVVKLNNDLEDADGALVLMKGLVELSSKVGASSEILTRLNEDKRAIERSQLEKHLLGYLKADRFGEALSAIENLLKITKVPKSEMRCRK